MKHFGLALAFVLVAAASFGGGILYQQAVGMSQQGAEIKKEKESWEQNIAEIDDLIARQNQTMGVMMDTQVRIFHYARPHEYPITACPECAEIIRRAKADPKLIEQEFEKLRGLKGTQKPDPAAKPSEPAPPKTDAPAKPAEPSKTTAETKK
ncbi:MAG: hypothetical protein U0903_12650 [Planctomycetales bacterium]